MPRHLQKTRRHPLFFFQRTFQAFSRTPLSQQPPGPQAESDFISELLQYLPNIGCLYTAGVGVTVFGNPLWVWQTTSQTIRFNRWWPGEMRWHRVGWEAMCALMVTFLFRLVI